MTAPLCPVHKRPGRYVFGSMVTCDVEDRELAAAKAKTPTVTAKTWTKVIVTPPTPRAPQVGDRALFQGMPIGTVTLVTPNGRHVHVRAISYTATYDVDHLTFEPPDGIHMVVVNGVVSI